MSVRRLVVTGLLLFFLAIGGVALLSYYRLTKSSGQLHALVPSSNETSYPIALLGDSLTSGVGATEASKNLAAQLLTDVKGTHPKATIDNFGVAGAKLGDVLNEQLPKLKQSYRLVVVVVGTNDIIQQTSYEVIKGQYHQLLPLLIAPSRQVIVANIPNFSATEAVPAGIKPIANSRTKEANDVLKKEISTTKAVDLFDFYSFSSKFLQPNSTLLSEDGFHPNDQGYNKLARAIADLVR